MSRTPCTIAPPEWRQPEPQNTITLKLRTITPMFGGGYEAREVDSVCIIRPAAIRGQLRFWWRATAGAKYDTPQELYAAEEALWGGAAREVGEGNEKKVIGPGKVAVIVKNAKTDGELVRLDKARVPDYVRAFLVQEKAETEKRIRQENRGNQDETRRQLRSNESQIEAEKNNLYAWVSPESSFNLTILCADADRLIEVQHAVKAFVLLGGIGGRTRRGFGCLDCGEWPSEFYNERIVLTGQDSASLGNAPSEVISLHGAQIMVGKAADDAFEAWNIASKMLQHFRKAELPGRTRPPKGTGSHTTWPEADTVRQLLRNSIQIHNPAFKGNTTAPRAAMGLPLKLQSQRNHAGYFGDATFKLSNDGEGEPRFGSPVIVRPLKINDKWHPAMIILHSPDFPTDILRASTNPATILSIDCLGAPTGLWDGSKNVPFNHNHHFVLDVLAQYLTQFAQWNLVEVSSL